MTWLWLQPTDIMCDVIINESHWIHVKIFFFYPTYGWDNVGEIRIPIPSEKLRIYLSGMQESQFLVKEQTSDSLITSSRRYDYKNL